MPDNKIIVVFVHGWSVTNTNTYGGLPVRLQKEASLRGINIQVEEIYLGRYISFHDEVRVKDISRAFRTAVEDELSDIIKDGTRFVCITHSTGGPVIRDWWHRYYKEDQQSGICPMSHLVMLAPANYGSALAQLGKGRLSRLKSWAEGIEPGQGVLDWLELGSKESWELNMEWISGSDTQIGPDGIFPFVLTGQYIDRKFYDNLNSYTGEIGSDGVVRVAAANLCGRYIKLEQEAPKLKMRKDEKVYVADKLEHKEFKEAPNTALRVISGTSHSGDKMGIMRSVNEEQGRKKGREVVDGILSCIRIKTKDQYAKLCDQFIKATNKIQEDERLEVETHFLKSKTYFFHDRFSMVIFRVYDEEDLPVTDFDLILTAGPKADPNLLPSGFFVDRQRNSLNPETIIYFLNYDVMTGAKAVKDKKGKTVRKKIEGAEMLGLKIVARPESGFVHYLPCEIKASRELLETALHPNSTTLIDIRLRRVVHKNVFRLDKMTDPTALGSFKDTKPGKNIVETKP